MNEFERMSRMAKHYKEAYPTGTRILLLGMDDPFAPIPAGTRGSVSLVDDIGQIHMKWDNGQTLAIIPGEDNFRRLTEEELAEEQNENMDESDAPVMGM